MRAKEFEERASPEKNREKKERGAIWSGRLLGLQGEHRGGDPAHRPGVRPPRIRVLTIAMGTSNTPLVKGLPEAHRESLGNQVPFPSPLGKPAEFAVLARHVIENRRLSDEALQLDEAIRMASE